MIRVLQINNGKEYSGVERLEEEINKYIDPKKIKIDILVANKEISKRINYKNVYNLDIYRNSFINRIKYDFRVYKFLKKNKYDIIHINGGAFFYSFRMTLISKICKIKKRIVHIHSISKCNLFKRMLITILNPFYRSMIDLALCCSNEVKTSLFTQSYINKNNNKIKVLKNGIDINKFKFNKGIREKIRKDLNIENKRVYGHIGRFSPEKNHIYLIDLFYQIQILDPNSVLVLIGDGILENDIKSKIKELNIENKVIFLGYKDNVYNYLNCIDIFIFPSIHEGLPLSLIEAQTNGLIVYCSNNITNDVNITSNFRYFDLKDNIKELANKIINEKYIDRTNIYKEVKKASFDIKDTSMELEKIYKRI